MEIKVSSYWARIYFWTRHFAPLLQYVALPISTFYELGQWLECVIFQINTNFLISQQNINSFTQETLYLFILTRTFGALHWNVLETCTFTIFVSMPPVGKVSNVWNKTDFLIGQQILIFLHKRSYISPSFPKSNWCFLSQRFLQASTF